VEPTESTAPGPKARLFQEATGFVTPALVAVLILLGVGSVARFSAMAEQGVEPQGPAPACAAEHESRGESHLVDLGALERGYAALKGRLTLSLQGARLDPAKMLEKPYDLGVVACRGRGERRVALKEALPAAYRSSKLYFLRPGGRVSASLPERIEKGPDAEIFLVSAANMRAVADLSRTLGRRVTLAPPKLLEVLGIRCANTLVTFTEKGDEAILAEGD